MGIAADQPVESNFFPGILEGLLGRLGIAAPGEKNPPTSSKESAARLWASAVMDAVQTMQKRWVRLETSGSSGMPTVLHLNYEEDFLNCQSHQVPGVFTDPLFLPNMVNSVYRLIRPQVLAEAPPFTAANDRPTTPVESVDDKDGTVLPSPSPCTAGTLTAEKGRAGLPATPLQIISDSDAGFGTRGRFILLNSSVPIHVRTCPQEVDSRQVRWLKGLQRQCPFPQEGNSKEGEGG